MSKPPLWATRIAATVAQEEGIEEPTIVWRRRGRKKYATMQGLVWRQPPGSSGRAGKDRILVTAGADSQDRRLVFYHELVHYVELAQGDPSPHDADFFSKVFGYVKRFGYCTMRHAKQSEFSYRVAAKAGYRQFKKEKES